MYKWKKILAALRAKGYTGDGTLDSVLAYVDENDIEIADSEGPIDLKKAFAASKAATKTVKITYDDDDKVMVNGEKMTGATGDDEDEKAQDEDDEDETKTLRGEIARLKGKLRRGHPTAGVDTGDDNGAGWGRSKAIERNSAQRMAAKSYDTKAQRSRAAGLPTGDDRATVFDTADEAEIFMAAFRLDGMAGKGYGLQGRDTEIIRKNVNANFSPTLGGALLSEIFHPQMLELVKQFGVMRQLASVYNTGTGEPYVISDLLDTDFDEARWTGETANVDRQPVNTGQNRIIANKIATRISVSNEHLNDSQIDLADLYARRLATRIAYREDRAFILGNGEANNGGFTGLAGRIRDADSSASAFDSGGNLAALDHDDILGVQALVPEYADRSGVPKVWLMSKRVYYSRFKSILFGASTGRGDVGEFVNGVINNPTIDGDPVIFSELMPKTTGVGNIAYYGAFQLGAHVQQVNGGIQVAGSEHAEFANDQYTWRATNRVGINIVRGDDTTEPGPIIGLHLTA